MGNKIKIAFTFTINCFKLGGLCLYTLIYFCNSVVNIISEILIKHIKRKRNEETLEINVKKRKIIGRAKEYLEAWFNNNKNYPYADKKDLKELSKLADLPELKIKRWLDNKRQKEENKPYKCFKPEEKSILTSFYDNQSDHPGPADLTLLSNLIKKDTKIIRAWFTKKRNLKKHTNNK